MTVYDATIPGPVKRVPAHIVQELAKMTTTFDPTHLAFRAPATELACTVSQESLKSALATVTRAAGGRTTIPVVHNVLLRVTGDSLELACTNLEIGLKQRIACTDSTDGAFTVPAKLLSDFVATLPSLPVALRAEKHSLRVTCGRAKAQFRGIDAEEFPPLPDPDGEPFLEHDAAALRQALRMTTFAAAQDELRPVLSGVHLAQAAHAASELTAEAADGFRASRLKTRTWHAEREYDVILCRPGAREALALLQDAQDDEKVALWLLPVDAEKPSNLVLRAGEVTLTARLLEGQFPSLDRVIPVEVTTTISVTRAVFLAAVKQVALFARDAANLVRLEADPAGMLRLSSNSSHVGESDAEVSCTVEGDAVTVSLSSVYLRDFLDAMSESEMVQIGVNGPLSPVRLTCETDGYVGVLMPMDTSRRG